MRIRGVNHNLSVSNFPADFRRMATTFRRYEARQLRDGCSGKSLPAQNNLW